MDPIKNQKISSTIGDALTPSLESLTQWPSVFVNVHSKSFLNKKLIFSVGTYGSVKKYERWKNLNYFSLVDLSEMYLQNILKTKCS